MATDRPLPETLTIVDNDEERRKARDRATRLATRQKKLAFTRIWGNIVTEYGETRLSQIFAGIPNPSDFVWRTCVSHRFRGFVPNSDQSVREMDMRVRTEVLSREARTPGITPPMRIPQRPLPPPQQPAFMYVVPPPPPPQRYQPRTPPPPQAMISDTMTPEEIEMAFMSRGLGESGKPCPVCYETKSKWCKFSTHCQHEMCLQCSEEFCKVSLGSSGVKCPGCLAEKVERPNYVDPKVMFDKSWANDHARTVFASFQIPHLQAELEVFEASNTTSSSSSSSGGNTGIHKCPTCMTVSDKEGVLRRCHNPRCAIEFCTRCDSAIEGDKIKHIRSECSVLVAETRQLLTGKGLTPCGKCGTPLWHAKHHGCHHVKCPSCAHEQCHSCGRPYKDPGCKCPIFCRPDFECKCSDTCPECEKSKCIHCDGYCYTCTHKK